MNEPVDQRQWLFQTAGRTTTKLCQSLEKDHTYLKNQINITRCSIKRRRSFDLERNPSFRWNDLLSIAVSELLGAVSFNDTLELRVREHIIMELITLGYHHLICVSSYP